MKVEEKEKIKLDAKIYAISSKRDQTYAGGSSKTLYKIEGQEKTGIYTFSKSVSSIDIKGEYLAASSFDSTACIFYKQEFLEKIEGPETEIKCIKFSEKNNFVALSTRGKTVWVCKNTHNNLFEIESILDDHVQDVKGVKFNGTRMYSYGYDNCVKVYDTLKSIDDSFSLIESLDFKFTVWDILFLEDCFLVFAENGFVHKVSFDFNIIKEERISMFPIYRATKIDENIFGFIYNLNSICFMNKEFEIEFILKDCGLGINCIDFNKETQELFIGDDSGYLKVFRVFLDKNIQ